MLALDNVPAELANSSQFEWSPSGKSGMTPRFEDSTFNVSVAPVKMGKRTGRRSKNHVHSLGLASAYGGSRTEPAATILTEKFKGCVDYIFYSRATLNPVSLLEMPNMNAIGDVDPRRPNKLLDRQDFKPKEWDDRSHIIQTDYSLGIETKMANPNFSGIWNPRSVPNKRRNHKWLPNSTLSSSHVALRVEMAYMREHLSSEWH